MEVVTIPLESMGQSIVDDVLVVVDRTPHPSRDPLIHYDTAPTRPAR